VARGGTGEAWQFLSPSAWLGTLMGHGGGALVGAALPPPLECNVYLLPNRSQFLLESHFS
jgi:hypothetical protein